jgi:hypothetical protein
MSKGPSDLNSELQMYEIMHVQPSLKVRILQLQLRYTNQSVIHDLTGT